MVTDGRRAVGKFKDVINMLQMFQLVCVRFIQHVVSSENQKRGKYSK